jgi:hypothetical protein
MSDMIRNGLIALTSDNSALSGPPTMEAVPAVDRRANRAKKWGTLAASARIEQKKTFRGEIEYVMLR